MVGVMIDAEDYVLDGASNGADHLANLPGKHAAAPIAIESLGQRTSYYLERILDTGLPLDPCRRAETTGRSNGRTRNPLSYQEQRRQ